MSEDKKPVLYMVICGAPPAATAHEFITLVMQDGWQVCAIASPQALKFANIPLIEEITRYPVRSTYKEPGTPDLFPKADLIVAAPVTFNTINKWALGIGDTLPASILCEYLGRGTPIIAAPWPNADLARHPQFSKSIITLIESGVCLLDKAVTQLNSEEIRWEVIHQTIEHIMNSKF